ncbi:hypothetical protein K461DRAFT_66043 [Myriangium duriaei CBS 260.36]|uniref:Uncharacterized protein n=1 Tax=Myriangium duriaei CBS 260.36 TaxID=1168546 RepID=A0A9P4IU74_9PEZI|nr:hypothetical protein K461DRAFT_66043 [Myriangium duriaei CBS 260.36]
MQPTIAFSSVSITCSVVGCLLPRADSPYHQLLGVYDRPISPAYVENEYRHCCGYTIFMYTFLDLLFRSEYRLFKNRSAEKVATPKLSDLDRASEVPELRPSTYFRNHFPKIIKPFVRPKVVILPCDRHTRARSSTFARFWSTEYSRSSQMDTTDK